MYNLTDNLQDWIILLGLIVMLAGATMETLVKPFIHELTSGFDDPAGFKKTNTYSYLIRISVFLISMLEAYPFRDDLNIFGILGVHEVHELAGVALAALIITFFSKQVHDFAQFIKAWANNKVVIPPAETPEVF